MADFQAEAEWLRQLPLVEALWLAIKEGNSRNSHVYAVLKERYRLEYELKEIK